jgi:hypothetical protein
MSMLAMEVFKRNLWLLKTLEMRLSHDKAPQDSGDFPQYQDHTLLSRSALATEVAQLFKFQLLKSMQTEGPATDALLHDMRETFRYEALYLHTELSSMNSWLHG